MSNIGAVKQSGSLAQLVEQRTFNPLVAGSNPARPTKIIKHLARFSGLFAFLALLDVTVDARAFF